MFVRIVRIHFRLCGKSSIDNFAAGNVDKITLRVEDVEQRIPETGLGLCHSFVDLEMLTYSVVVRPPQRLRRLPPKF